MQGIQGPSGGQFGMQPAAAFASWREGGQESPTASAHGSRGFPSFCKGPGMRRLVHSRLWKECWPGPPNQASEHFIPASCRAQRKRARASRRAAEESCSPAPPAGREHSPQTDRRQTASAPGYAGRAAAAAGAWSWKTVQGIRGRFLTYQD